jgi:tRNA A-37 threonylcarbamoyl transferase component Bud32
MPLTMKDRGINPFCEAGARFPCQSFRFPDCFGVGYLGRMPPDAKSIAHCHACGGVIDVSKLAPFSKAKCPACGETTRVKVEFGPYILHHRHAIGGMSVVFIAKDKTLNRDVAVKILNEDYSADERRISAFEEEARTTASISHPHVVRLLTTGRAFGRYYLAMELVTGGNFEIEIRDRGALAETEVLPLALQVAEGLQAAHAAGLIHRDMKPGNILLDGAGKAKIVDFGLALMTKGGKAQASEIWATSYYVPPETVEGAEEDFRSDIYAFGATLYHALAGVPPCNTESQDTKTLREAKKKIAPLAEAAPWLSPETCVVIDRAMAYKPADRYQSYDEMIFALRQAQQRSLAGPQIENAGAVLRRQMRTAKRKEALILAGAGLLLIGAIFAAVHFIRSRPSGETAIAKPSPVVEVVVRSDETRQSIDPAITSRIGQRYKAAREAVEKGSFEQALTDFAALRDDPVVQEPTRTWAGLEAIAAGYLGDKGEAARTQAKLTAAHASTVEFSNPKVSSVLVPALNLVQELPSIPVGNLDPAGADAPTVMAWLISGLKNWQQGSLDEAAEFFRAVGEVKLSTADQWANHYQKVAADYLADFARLQAAEPIEMPSDKEACLAKIAELDEVVGSLVTQGRARFNVREWQLELRRHVRQLEVEKASPEVPAPMTLTAARPEVDRLCQEFKFDKAVALLDSLSPSESEIAIRDALKEMLGLAAAFLGDLQTDLKTGEVLMELKSRDGAASYAKISNGEDGKLKAVDPKGAVHSLEWKDLAPDSIIELHRVLTRDLNSDSIKLRRHESAIAFEWVGGDRKRATAAADRLAVENPAFKARWQKMVSALK